MLLDSLVLRTLAIELASRLDGVRIEKVHQPEAESLALKLYPAPEGRHLAIGVDRQFGFAALSTSDLANPATPPAFCALLRKYLTSGRILSVKQPGLERILEFEVSATRDEEKVRSRLLVELFGNMPNAYLLNEDGRILGAMRPWSALERLAGGLYIPPSPVGRPSILETTNGEFLVALARAAGSAKLLAGSFDGLGVGLATWLIGLSATDSAEAAWQALEVIRTAVTSEDPSILVLPAAGGTTLLVPWLASAPWPGGGASGRLFQSPSEAVEACLGGGAIQSRVAQAALAVKTLLARESKRIRQRLERVRADRERASEADRFERWGHLLQAHPDCAGPYESSVTLRDLFEPETPEVMIPLEPGRTVSASAQAYFNRARRMRRAVPMADAAERECLQSMELLEQSSREVDRVAGEPGPRALTVLRGLQERIAGGGEASPRRQREGSGFREFLSSDGRRILVGRSSRENDRLSTREARRGDLWLHAHGAAGAHVVVKLGGAECPRRTLEEAAQLAAHFSPLRYSAKARVSFTRAENVKKPPGAPEGLVTLRSEETLMVACDASVPARLLARVEPAAKASPYGSGKRSRTGGKKR